MVPCGAEAASLAGGPYGAAGPRVSRETRRPVGALPTGAGRRAFPRAGRPRHDPLSSGSPSGEPIQVAHVLQTWATVP